MRHIAPADLNLKGCQCSRQAFIAAHSIQKVALIQFFDARKFPGGYQLGFKFFNFPDEQGLEFFTGLQIGIAFFF